MLPAGTVGSGLATAKRFAREGYAVFITSRDAARAQQAAEEVAAENGVFARGYGLDIGDEEAVKAVFTDIDATGCLVRTVVLNAANMGFGSDPAKGQPVFSVTIEDFRSVFETNLVWNFMIVRQAALRMRQHGGGSHRLHQLEYGLPGYPQPLCLFRLQGRHQCHVPCTGGGSWSLRHPQQCGAARHHQDGALEAMGDGQIVNGSLTPIGDISDFEDIANAAWYLGSEASKNVTGTELTVDGGMSCQLYPQLLNRLKQQLTEGD